MLQGAEFVQGTLLPCPFAGVGVDLNETVISEGSFDSPLHPGGDIGSEVAAFRVIATVGGLDEGQVGLLHQVRVEITAAAWAQVGGDRGRQPQVALDEPLLDLGDLLRRERQRCGGSQRGEKLALFLFGEARQTLSIGIVVPHVISGVVGENPCHEWSLSSPYLTARGLMCLNTRQRAPVERVNRGYV